MRDGARRRERPEAVKAQHSRRSGGDATGAASALRLLFIAIFFVAAAVGVALAGRAGGEAAPTAAPLPPVYLTIVSHNEEGGAGRPVYTADLNYYLQNRSLVKLLAETITSRGATYNFQSDWNYLKAVAMYDVGSVTNDTAGKNIVRWMKEDLGVEVDPHAHESQYNYADVAYLIEQLGVTTSKNVGGFLYDPPDNPQGWEQHEAGISGWIYPSYFWRADNLWGAGTYLHLGNDDASSGIWRPKDRYNFYVDDPNQRLLYIGGGCGSPPVLQLLDDIQTGSAPAGGFYTANLMMIQDWMTTQSIAQLGSFIDSMAPYVAQGRVQWVTLTQMADLWRTQYGSQPSRYDCSTGTATPAPSVGGIAELPAMPGPTRAASGSLPFDDRARAAVLAAAIGAAGGLWYTRKRWLR